jgi:hypothetical protein
VNWPKVIGILFILVIYVTMVYGPIAAILVEMFPTRIRYTGMSLPYHIGNGWFGGLLPATVFAMSAAAGDIYYGLWYPIVIAGMSLVIGTLFVKDTLGTDLHAKDSRSTPISLRFRPKGLVEPDGDVAFQREGQHAHYRIAEEPGHQIEPDHIEEPGDVERHELVDQKARRNRAEKVQDRVGHADEEAHEKEV